MKNNSLKDRISNHALGTAGFDDCRFCDPHVDEYLKNYQKWLREGRHGDMAYLKEHLAFKERPEKLLNAVHSAIVVIKNYKNTPERRLSQKFKIARYAVGKDYHIVIKERLEKIADFIKKEDPSAECYTGVDSRPIAERALAVKAGVGFLGKNTMVIKPGLGSYFFIGVIFTTAQLDFDTPLKWDCGQCRLCLDACPTNAFIKPYELDATRCISYMTIEQKEELSKTQLKQTQGWLFGCDICQEVCPYNSERIALTGWNEFLPASGVGFDFFETKGGKEGDIPKETPLYRSRKRVIPNWQNAIKEMGGT